MIFDNFIKKNGSKNMVENYLNIEKSAVTGLDAIREFLEKWKLDTDCTGTIYLLKEQDLEFVSSSIKNPDSISVMIEIGLNAYDDKGMISKEFKRNFLSVINSSLPEIIIYPIKRNQNIIGFFITEEHKKCDDIEKKISLSFLAIFLYRYQLEMVAMTALYTDPITNLFMRDKFYECLVNIPQSKTYTLCILQLCNLQYLDSLSSVKEANEYIKKLAYYFKKNRIDAYRISGSRFALVLSASAMDLMPFMDSLLEDILFLSDQAIIKIVFSELSTDRYRSIACCESNFCNIPENSVKYINCAL